MVEVCAVRVLLLMWLFPCVHRLLLIQEKEQLLRELQGISPTGRSEEEMNSVKNRIHQLEVDLQDAMQLSNRQIAERCVLILNFVCVETLVHSLLPISRI